MKPPSLLVLLAGLLGAAIPASAAEESSAMPTRQLSAATRALLQEEMRGIGSGMQTLTTALAAADWTTLQTTAEQIRDSYILVRRLSTAQRKELLHVLPNGFRVLDRNFHRRADRLAAAAAAHDSDLATFYIYRMMDSCVACHSQYAGERFPAFHPPEQDEHADHDH